MNVLEYSAFLCSLLSQFIITNTPNEDWKMPYLDSKRALENIKPKFKNELLENLIINNINTKKIDRNFFNVTDITKKPLVKFDDGIIIPLSLKQLFIGLTDSVYFDILDYIPEKKQKDKYSKFFGKAVEDYFKDIIRCIDSGAVFEFEYGKDNRKTSDAMMVRDTGVIFFECKKLPFHNLQFLQNGNKEIFLERVHEFYYKPLNQICDRIKDFRNEKFKLTGIDKNARIYPVIVCPSCPPIFSGGWEKFNLDKYVLPDLYDNDHNIAPPEFIDFSELECIEEYLRLNPKISFIDLIKIKRKDQNYHHANWIVILDKNNMALQNKRLAENFLEKMKDFKNILF